MQPRTPAQHTRARTARLASWTSAGAETRAGVGAFAFARTVAWAIVCALASPAWALDLLQTYQAALANDASLQAAQAAAASGREALPQARAQMGPQLSASLSRYQNDLTSKAPNLFGVAQSTQNHYFSSNQTLTLRQALLRPAQWAQLRQAQALVQSSDATLDQALQTLGLRVSEAYFAALLADEQLALVLAQKESFGSQRDAAQQALAAGSSTRTDIAEAQARLDLALAQELEARQNQDATRRQLLALVSQAPDPLTPLTPQTPLTPLAPLDAARMPLLAPEPADLEAWVRRAEQGSPELHALLAQVEVARQEVARAQAGHYPTLDAIAQWSSSESENVVAVHSRYDNASVGLQLFIPLFASGQVRSLVRQALAEQERAAHMAEALRRDLGLRVNQAFRGVTEGIARVRALEQAVRSAEQLLTSSRRAMQAGSRTLLDVLNAEQQRMLALRDLAQARYQTINARIRLQALAGGSQLAAMTEVNGWLAQPQDPDAGTE